MFAAAPLLLARRGPAAAARGGAGLLRGTAQPSVAAAALVRPSAAAARSSSSATMTHSLLLLRLAARRLPGSAVPSALSGGGGGGSSRLARFGLGRPARRHQSNGGGRTDGGGGGGGSSSSGGRGVGGGPGPRSRSNRPHVGGGGGAALGLAVGRQAKAKGAKGAFSAWCDRRPVLSSAVVMALKAWLADLVVQHAMEGRATTDVARSALFAAFGASYQGVGQYFMINVLLERRLFPGRALRDVLAKVAATNLLMDPLVFFPCFYTMREVMTGGGGDGGGGGGMRARLAAPVETVSAALGKYRTNMLVDWRNSWLVWVPAHCVTYGLCPVHLRISWMASVSFSYVL